MQAILPLPRNGIGRAVRAALLLGPLLASAGCRTAWPAPPSEEARAAFGSVAVTVAPEFGTGVGRPTTGWLRGLGFGVLRGGGAIVVFTVYGAAGAAQGARGEAGGVAAMFGGALGAAVGVLYFPVSVTAGALTAADSEAVAGADIVVRPIVEDPGLAATFAGRFESEARAATGRAFVPPDAADTVVEIRLDSVTGGQTWDLITVDAPFEIRVAATARVLRRADGKVIWEATREVPADTAKANRHTYLRWAESDGAPLRQEIDDALTSLARSFAWSIFVQERGEKRPDDGVGSP